MINKKNYFTINKEEPHILFVPNEQNQISLHISEYSKAQTLLIMEQIKLDILLGKVQFTPTGPSKESVERVDKEVKKIQEEVSKDA